MDKKSFIAYLRKEDYLAILREYCVEKGKEITLINCFLGLLPLTPIYSSCVEIAVRYYKEKLRIVTLFDVSGKEIQYY